MDAQVDEIRAFIGGFYSFSPANGDRQPWPREPLLDLSLQTGLQTAMVMVCSHAVN